MSLAVIKIESLKLKCEKWIWVKNLVIDFLHESSLKILRNWFATKRKMKLTDINIKKSVQIFSNFKYIYLSFLVNSWAKTFSFCT